MTTVVGVDALHPEPELIAQAAAVLSAGGLVAFPTETVYGLGAAATDRKATARVFEAKERPASSPLIVHVASIEQARGFAANWTKSAQLLAEAFWPGPLSIVVEKSPVVPSAVSAGGETVALRSPAHPVALALIAALGDGIAAPSANRSSRLPPVRAQHVLKGLDGRIEMVIDAGACPGGLESTVVELSGERARIVRRGAISLERILRVIEVQDAAQLAAVAHSWIRQAAGDVIARCEEARAGAVLLEERQVPLGMQRRVLGGDAGAYGGKLYDALHELEDAGCETVWIEELPAGSEWDAIRDRLARLQR